MAIPNTPTSVPIAPIVVACPVARSTVESVEPPTASVSAKTVAGLVSDGGVVVAEGAAGTTAVLLPAAVAGPTPAELVAGAAAGSSSSPPLHAEAIVRRAAASEERPRSAGHGDTRWHLERAGVITAIALGSGYVRCDGGHRHGSARAQRGRHHAAVV